MAGSIREAMNNAIEKRALVPAARAWGLDDVGAVEQIVLPMLPLVGQVADAATTAMALNRGFSEGNPLMRGVVKSLPLWFALKVGVGAGIAFGVKRFQDTGHKNAARVVSVVGTLFGAGPALSNLHLMGKI